MLQITLGIDVEKVNKILLLFVDEKYTLVHSKC